MAREHGSACPDPVATQRSGRICATRRGSEVSPRWHLARAPLSHRGSQNPRVDHHVAGRQRHLRAGEHGRAGRLLAASQPAASQQESCGHCETRGRGPPGMERWRCLALCIPRQWRPRSNRRPRSGVGGRRRGGRGPAGRPVPDVRGSGGGTQTMGAPPAGAISGSWPGSEQQ